MIWNMSAAILIPRCHIQKGAAFKALLPEGEMDDNSKVLMGKLVANGVIEC
jgi:hypothetical protein